MRYVVLVLACVVASAAKAQDVMEVGTNSLGMKFVKIPAGEFKMGKRWREQKLTQDGPGRETFVPTDKIRGLDEARPVTLTRPFYLGIHEITNRQWQQVMGISPNARKDPDLPVVNVSWNDVNHFCQRLSALHEERAAGRVYRLPTEAEWEHACRAGTDTVYSFGNDESELGDYAWVGQLGLRERGGNSGGHPHPVGQKKPNAWGLYDMHGNVSEWCSDWFRPDDGYGNAKPPAIDPRGPSIGSARVYCGSNFHWDPVRLGQSPSKGTEFIGFRVALSPPGN